MTLTGKQKRHLRGLGHHLSPVVMIGHQGLTDAVVAHLDRALEDHELVKIKTLGDELAETSVGEVSAALAEKTGSVVVQTLGHTALLYRRRRKEPGIELPK